MKRDSKTIAESLEAIANEITNKLTLDSRVTPQTKIECEIAFVSEQLDRVRKVHEQQRSAIVRAETYVDTDLMKLDSYHLRHFTQRHKVRDNLKTKLLKLDMERRKLLGSSEQRISELQRELLTLITKHLQLRKHGHIQTSI